MLPAADNGDRPSDLRRLAHGNAPQEVDTAQHALQLFAGAAHTGALPRANGDDGRIVLLAEIVKGNVLANADIVLQLDADRGDLLNLFVYDRLRQPVFRNAVAQHTAHLGHGVYNRHVVALAGQVISRCQAAGDRRR